MKILIDNVIKDARHIYDHGDLELEDQRRMKGIIEALEALKKEQEE